MPTRAESIHPRMLYSGDARRKRNTAKPRSVARLERARAGIERHLTKTCRTASADFNKTLY